MKWRTDKPTADIIVAEIKDRGYKIMYISNADINYYLDDNGEEFSYTEFVKWADLEEDEGTICPQKQRKRPNKVYEYPVEVPNNDGCLEFIYMTNSTIRKKLRLKKGERAIISIRKEV